MASVHLEKGGEAGKWKEGGIPETPRTKPSKCLGSSTRTAPPGAATPSGGLCSRRFSLSAQSRGRPARTTGRRLWSQSAPRSPARGLPGPRRRRHHLRCCFSAAWATGSSTGLCCVTDGVACSQTGRCSQ